jgi:tRNA threonylcarbamoyladenosine biosynthesis protein TsaB
MNTNCKNILAIDTATEVLSAALKTEKGQWYIEIDAGLRHSELLMEVCDKLTKMAGISQQEINLVACMKGPGSFTGLRIGFSAAKGIASALNIPFISVPTLDCMAYSYRFLQAYVLPVIDAKKQCFFTALYHQDTRLHEYVDATAENILSFLPADKPALVCGPAAALLAERLQEIPHPFNLIFESKNVDGYAKCLLEKAEKQCIMNVAKGDSKGGDSSDSGPMYLRKSDAELSVMK